MLRTFVGVLMTAALLAAPRVLPAQATAAGASPAEKAIATAQAGGRYAYLLFYRQNDTATQAMHAALKSYAAAHEGTSDLVFAQVGNPVEQALVTKHGVARAPVPLTVVLAPNGAVTGVFSQKLTTANLDDAFVSPTMMAAMKSLQAGKLVLVSVQGSLPEETPAVVREFQSDPHFQDRLTTAALQAADPREAKFVGQMKIDPRTTVSQVVLLAPPGVLVGKFAASATKDEVAAALAKAGKCCDDPNCKHNQATLRSAAGGSGARQQQ